MLKYAVNQEATILVFLSSIETRPEDTFKQELIDQDFWSQCHNFGKPVVYINIDVFGTSTYCSYGILADLMESIKQRKPTPVLEKYLESHNVDFLETVKLFMNKIDLKKKRIALKAISRPSRPSFFTGPRAVVEVPPESRKKAHQNASASKLERAVMGLFHGTQRRVYHIGRKVAVDVYISNKAISITNKKMLKPYVDSPVTATF
jgi:hypothetical protein